jgi:hypothetical protein
MWDILKTLAKDYIKHICKEFVIEHVSETIKDWYGTHEEVENELKEQKRNVARQIDAHQKHLDYISLIALHHRSYSLADNAYSLLNNTREAIESLNTILRETKIQRDDLHNKLCASKTEADKGTRRLQIDNINKDRKDLFAARDKLNADCRIFLDQVQTLNLQTHELKLAIRDRTGPRGEEWHRRLEERKAYRNSLGSESPEFVTAR